MIAVYTITSGLHDEAAVSQLSDAFLKGVFPEGDYQFKGSDFSDFGTHTLDLIYVRTGGAEGIFKALLPEMLARGIDRYYLLTSGKSNSLAASLEILSYLRQQGLRGEVLHGNNTYVASRIQTLAAVQEARARLKDMRIGVIGQPSDWLIASHMDPMALLDKLGVRMEEVPMEELLTEIAKAEGEPAPAEQVMDRKVRDAYPGAVQIYKALKVLAERHNLDAFTLRCFDLLSTVGNTGCLALSCFNSEGIPASCEGDVPALVSMMIAHALTGVSGFQANPARIDVQTGEIFESGIGVGIHGIFPKGPVTVFKVSGDLKRHFAAEGELVGNQYEQNLCRTQVIVRLNPSDARYFLTEPIGNHHIILPGHCKGLLEELL